MNKPIAILGGTFDPIHFGHLRTALEIYQQYDLKEVRLVPCQQPLLKKSSKANIQQRLAMLKLATTQQTHLIIDNRELKRTTPSYTIDTLISMRSELPNTPLWLILGSDILHQLNQWHRWRELMTFAHLLIIVRPDHVLPKKGLVANFIQQHLTSNIQLLRRQPAGKIYIAHLSPLTISATAIRLQLKKGLSPRYLLPENVLNYIKKHKLYTH